MPRPRKCRKVCQMPQIREFRPVGETAGGNTVVLTVDEYEAIRLIDRQGFSQEECSIYMQVARTTVQLIYNSARKKLADALVDGLPLRIEGGHYQLCAGDEEYCGCGGCWRHRRDGSRNSMEDTIKDGIENNMEDNVENGIEEAKSMKIAVPLDENKQDVCIVLARAPYFLFREEGKNEVAENPAASSQGGAGIQAAQFLVDQGINAVITVRCGENAREVFQAADIKIYKSANKAAADDLAAMERGELQELTQFHGGYHGVQ